MKSTIKGRSDVVVALRNFSYIWVVLAVVSFVNFWVISTSDVEPMRRTYAVVHAVIFALYLSLPKLEQRMGPLYLPVAFGIAVFGLLIVQIVSVLSGFRFDNAEQLSVIFNVVTVMSICTVIILIMGWKYHLYQVIVMSVIYSVIVAISIALAATPDFEHFVAAVIVIPPFIAIFLGAIGYFVWRLSQAEQSQRQQLAVANGRLRRQAIQREELTISRERNRLARELHDTLAHSLSGVTVQIEAALALWQTNPDAAEMMLSQANDMARTGLTEARRALQSLRATPLQDLGLGLALQVMSEDVAARAGAALKTDLPRHLTTDLEAHVEQNLYRIAQEALENIVRHARAKTISLRLVETADELQLEIVDDGIGFDANSAASEGHYGLQGMVERAALSDASLTMESKIGQGTAIKLRKAL